MTRQPLCNGRYHFRSVKSGWIWICRGRSAYGAAYGVCAEGCAFATFCERTTCLLLRDVWPPPAREVRYVGKMPFQSGPAPLRKDASAAMSAAEDVLRRNRQTRRDANYVALSVFGVSVTHRSQRHIFCLRTLNPSLSQRCRFHSTLGEGVRRTSPEEVDTTRRAREGRSEEGGLQVGC